MLLGAVIIFELLFTLAVCALLLAGRGFDYWRCIYLAKDAIDCIRPSMGVMLFGSLIMQAIDPRVKIRISIALNMYMISQKAPNTIKFGAFWRVCIWTFTKKV